MKGEARYGWGQTPAEARAKLVEELTKHAQEKILCDECGHETLEPRHIIVDSHATPIDVRPWCRRCVEEVLQIIPWRRGEEMPLLRYDQP